MATSYDPLHDLALLLAATTQTAGAQPRVIADPLHRLASRLGFDHGTDPSEIEDALRGAVERRVRREMAREVLALDEAERGLMRSGAPHVGPYGDAVISLRKVARGAALPEPHELHGGNHACGQRLPSRGGPAGLLGSARLRPSGG